MVSRARQSREKVPPRSTSPRSASVFSAPCLTPLGREPHRRRLNAVMVTGADAACLGGGLGGRELAFTAVAARVAFRGLEP